MNYKNLKFLIKLNFIILHLLINKLINLYLIYLYYLLNGYKSQKKIK